MLQKSAFLLFLCTFLSYSFLSASSFINSEDHPSGLVEISEMVADHHITKTEVKVLKKEEKRLVRFENLMARLSKMSSYGDRKHASGLFNDPVNRWFWLWLITWGFGILLLVVSSGGLTSPAIGIIWLLAFAIGSVALILWLVKKFS